MDSFGRRTTLCVLAAATLVFPSEPRQIENRKLTWADFKGKPEIDSPYDAYTYWSVHYSYDAPMREGAGFRVTVRAWNQLDNRSWVKPRVLLDQKSAELLNHEQGHYTLGVLCALEFKQAVSVCLFDGNCHAGIRATFDEILKKYVDMEKVYDTETGHMHNRPGQAAWDRRLAQMVSERWGDR